MPAVTAEIRARESRILEMYRGAEDLWIRGEYDAAVEALRPILEIDIHHPFPQKGIVEILLLRGNLAGGRPLLEEFAGPSDPALRYGRGLALLFERRTEEAEPLLRSAVSDYATLKHPAGLAATWTALGIIESWTSRYDEAVAHFDRALELTERLGDRGSSAELLGHLATVHEKTGDEAEALAAYRRSLTAQEEVNDRAGSAATLQHIGLILLDRGETGLARDSLSRALALDRQLGDRTAEGRSIQGLGRVLLAPGEIEGASAAFEQALEIALEQEDRRAEADALTGSGLVALRSGEAARAIDLHRQAVRIRRDLGDRTGEADSLYHIGTAHDRMGETDLALKDFESALALLDPDGGPRARARVLESLGALRGRLRDRSGGMAALERAAALYDRLGGLRGVARTKTRLGEMLMDAADYPGARSSLDQALEAWQRIDDAAGTASALRSLGNLHRRLGSFDTAIECLERALALVDAESDPATRAAVLSDLGEVRFARGDYTLALQLQNESLVMRRDLDDRSAIPANLNALSAIYRALGDSRQAVAHTREALQLLRESGDHRGEALARSNLGVLLEEAGDDRAAATEFKAAAGIRDANEDRGGSGYARFQLAGVLLRLDLIGDATRELETALRTFRLIGDRGGEALIQVALGDIARDQGRVDDAMRLYEEALGHAAEAGESEAAWRGRAGVAACLEAGEKWAQAMRFYEEAIDGAESVHPRLPGTEFRSAFPSGRIDLYRRAVRLLSHKGGSFLEADPAERAFGFAERERARSLLDLFADTGSDLRRGVDPDLLAREAGMLARIGQLEADLLGLRQEEERGGIRRALDGAEQEMDLLRAEIRQNAPLYAAIAYPRPVGAEGLRTDTLRPGEVVLEYLIGEDTSWLWALTVDGTRWWELPGRVEIQNQVLRLLGALRGSEDRRVPATAHVEPARQLARTLLPEGSIPDGARIVIVPDGILNYLPFEALLIGSGDTGGKDRYLIESHVVSYSPSASVLRILRDRPAGLAPGNRLLAMGDPSTDNLPESWDIPNLPFAHEEIMRIGRLFPEPDRALRVGPAAAEAVLKSEDLADYRFIHLAAQGWIHEDAPIQTSIFLGRDADHADDGLLRFNEIFQLHMNAELLVLSGSRTGFRTPVRGEGMVGLNRALMYSGAHSVMVSLWNVNDESTPRLMETLYRGLIRGQEPAVALRAAKLALLRSGTPTLGHPSRWAPFLLNGDPGNATAVADRSNGG